MRILFDQGTPVPLKKYFDDAHDISTAFELGWARLQNGELISRAESARFDLFITTDKNLRYQQNLKGRTMAIMVLSTTSWPKIRSGVSEVQLVVKNIKKGEYVEVFIP